MKFIGGKLRRWEKAKWGNFGDRINSKIEKQILLLHRWVHLVWTFMNIYSTKRWYEENKITRRDSVVSCSGDGCALKGLGNVRLL